MYKDCADDELIDLLSKDSKEAFDEIYRRHWSAMYLAGFNMLQDHDACMDVVQDVFVWIWNKRAELGILSLKSYLISAVKYKVTNVIRKSKLRQSFLDQVENEEPSFNNVTSELELKELKEVLVRFTAELPDRCREVFDLSRNEHLSNKEISKKMGISEKAVERQMTIALKRLKISLLRMFLFSILLFVVS
ncbi:RNA polymerase sigma-70 factor [Pedobacter sp. PWIIR3]